MIEMVDYSLSFNKENRVIAFLWHQGEHDAFEGNEPDVFEQQLRDMVLSVRERYGKMPFIAGDFVREWKEENFDICIPIVEKIRKVINDIGNAAFVDTADLLSNNEKTFAIMEENASSYILCGHSHVQGKIEHKGKVVLNAGAVGVSLHGDGKAQFMILEGAEQKWNFEFISLEYDVEKVIEDLYISGLMQKAPAWCKVSANLLRTGETSHGTVLAKAMELCRNELGECNWPDVPEKYWDLAVKEI